MDNSIDIQCKLLGCYMKNPDLFANVENLVRVTTSLSVFTTPALTESYKIIKDYHSKNIEPDAILIWKALHKIGIDKEDAAVVSKFDIYSYLSEEHVKEYVGSLFSDYVGKYLAPKMKQFILNRDTNDPIEEMIKVKDAITNVELALNGVNKDKSIKIQFDEAIKRMIDLKSGEVERFGFSWGVPSLDKKTMGIVQGINIVAGDKGSGKTSLLVNVIRYNFYENKLPGLFFSLEMTALEVITNLVANVKRINSRALRTGSIDEVELEDIKLMRNKLEDNFAIDETGGITWEYIEAKIRSHRKKHKVPYSQTMLVLLDYLQIMKNSPGESRMSKEEKIEQISNELMRICKNENIAMVKLSQFSREGNRRGDNQYIKTDEERLKALRPRMGDLKGSSAIESNAISILMLFRGEYYGIYEANGLDLRGLCEINIVKGRYVDPKPMYVKFNGKYNLFDDLDMETVNGGIITSGEESF